MLALAEDIDDAAVDDRAEECPEPRERLVVSEAILNLMVKANHDELDELIAFDSCQPLAFADVRDGSPITGEELRPGKFIVVKPIDQRDFGCRKWHDNSRIAKK